MTSQETTYYSQDELLRGPRLPNQVKFVPMIDDEIKSKPDLS